MIRTKFIRDIFNDSIDITYNYTSNELYILLYIYTSRWREKTTKFNIPECGVNEMYVNDIITSVWRGTLDPKMCYDNIVGILQSLGINIIDIFDGLSQKSVELHASFGIYLSDDIKLFDIIYDTQNVKHYVFNTSSDIVCGTAILSYCDIENDYYIYKGGIKSKLYYKKYYFAISDDGNHVHSDVVEMDFVHNYGMMQYPNFPFNKLYISNDSNGAHQMKKLYDTNEKLFHQLFDSSQIY